MGSAPRFYLPLALTPSAEQTLPPTEGRHLARVLRLGAGALIRVFDGRGHEHDATVARVDARRVTVHVGDAVAAVAEPRVAVTLAVTLLKGRKIDGVIRDATMLGVTTVVPLLSARTHVGSVTREEARLVERWFGVAVASAKQCGRATVPAVRPPTPVERWLADRDADDLRLWLVEPDAVEADAPATTIDILAGGPPPAAAAVAIGPEGGWTRDEIAAARAAGFHLVTLGARTLRADAVPVAALSVLRYVWRDL